VISALLSGSGLGGIGLGEAPPFLLNLIPPKPDPLYIYIFFTR
jgi:hypothetical protein